MATKKSGTSTSNKTGVRTEGFALKLENDLVENARHMSDKDVEAMIFHLMENIKLYQMSLNIMYKEMLLRTTTFEEGDILSSVNGVKRAIVKITGIHINDNGNPYWMSTMLDKEFKIGKKHRIIYNINDWVKVSKEDAEKIREAIEIGRKGRKTGSKGRIVTVSSITKEYVKWIEEADDWKELERHLFNALVGDHNKELRQEIMLVLTGKTMNRTLCGIRRVLKEAEKWYNNKSTKLDTK